MRPDPHPPLAPTTAAEGRPSRAALVVDAGSSATKLALAHAGRLTRLGTFATGDSDADGWEVRFAAAAAAVVAGTPLTSIGHVAMSSVVPSLAGRLRAWWAAQHGAPTPVRTVSAATVPLAVDYRPASALGPDRLAGAVAAVAGWGAPVVVADVGTAITCDLVSAGGRFAGGVITPGPWTAYQGLVDRLPHLALDGLALDGLALDGLAVAGGVPAPGTSTADGVRAGVIRGAAGVVDGIARTYLRLVGPCPVIVTGGLGALVAPYSDLLTAVDPDLTLRGIHLTCSAASDPRPTAASPAAAPA